MRPAPVIVSPPIWSGLAHYKKGHIGTITLSFETYIAMVCDVCRSIHANGFERIVLLNGHGGNRAINQALGVKLAEEDIFILPITYWDMIQEILDTESIRDHGSIGHAGEWETSLQLYLRPELVDWSRVRGDEERPDLCPRPVGSPDSPNGGGSGPAAFMGIRRSARRKRASGSSWRHGTG